MLTLKQRALLAKDWWDGDELNVEGSKRALSPSPGDPGKGPESSQKLKQKHVSESDLKSWMPPPLDDLILPSFQKQDIDNTTVDLLNWKPLYDQAPVKELLKNASISLPPPVKDGNGRMHAREYFDSRSELLEFAGTNLYDYQLDAAMRSVWQLAESGENAPVEPPPGSAGDNMTPRPALSPILILAHATGSGKTRTALLIARVMLKILLTARLPATRRNGVLPYNKELVAKAVERVRARIDKLDQDTRLSTEAPSKMHSILVICKKSTARQWEREIATFSPAYYNEETGEITSLMNIPVVSITDANSAKMAYNAAQSGTPKAYVMYESNVLISAQPDNQRRMTGFTVEEFAKKLNIGVGIYDEVQGLRGKVKRFNIETISKQCFFTTCLSGTVLLNKVGNELYMTIGMLSGDLGKWTAKLIQKKATDGFPEARVLVEGAIPYMHKVEDAQVHTQANTSFQVRVHARIVPFFMQSQAELDAYNSAVEESRRLNRPGALGAGSSSNGGDATEDVDAMIAEELEKDVENQQELMIEAATGTTDRVQNLESVVELNDNENDATKAASKKDRQIAYNKIKRYSSLPMRSTEIQGATINPKTEFVTSLIFKSNDWYLEQINQARKWIVASYNVEHLKQMYDHFKDHDANVPSNIKRGHAVNVYEFHGEVKEEVRQDNLERFMASDGSNFEILFLGIQAGGEGIRLVEDGFSKRQNCCKMIITDMAWNVAKMRQTISRIARIGQNNSIVDIYVMLVDHSLDIATARLVVDKQNSITNILSRIGHNVNRLALEERVALQKTTSMIEPLSEKKKQSNGVTTGHVTFYNPEQANLIDRSFVRNMQTLQFMNLGQTELTEKLQNILY